MFRKLLFLGATIWLGKKGYDALMAAQNDAADFVDTEGSTYASGSTGASDTPLNPVLNPEIAARLHDVKLEAAEVNDPA